MGTWFTTRNVKETWGGYRGSYFGYLGVARGNLTAASSDDGWQQGQQSTSHRQLHFRDDLRHTRDQEMD